MDNVKTVLSVLVAIGIAVGVSGCREDEQDRLLHMQKGVYSGETDTALTDEQRRALVQRGRLQKF